jgi:DNA helicase HerA-like ATPase
MSEEQAVMATAAENHFSAFKKEMCIGKVLTGRHCLVIGATGSGKTFWMANVANRFFNRFIFCNPQMEESVSGICHFTTEEPDEVIESLMDGVRAIEFIPAEDVDEAIDQLASLRVDLFGMAQEMRAEGKIEDGAFWLDFILDEAQMYAWKGSRNDVDNFATRGRHWGIRNWFLTQRPQNLSSTIINNVQYQVIFRTGSYESQYFRTYKIPIEAHAGWLKKDYHYILWDGFDAQECTPVKGGK